MFGAKIIIKGGEKRETISFYGGKLAGVGYVLCDKEAPFS